MENSRPDKTPSGGDYSEIYFFDDDWNTVPDDRATCGVVRECREDSTLIQETYFRMSK